MYSKKQKGKLFALRELKKEKPHCLGEYEAMLAVGRSVAVVRSPSLSPSKGWKAIPAKQPDVEQL